MIPEMFAAGCIGDTHGLGQMRTVPCRWRIRSTTPVSFWLLAPVPIVCGIFWAASPRAAIPPGKLEGCTVKVRARISHGALLQVGFDYWRDSIVGYGAGANNHEAGASEWYLPSVQWQEAEFTDIRPLAGS